jgi:preprotein translocase subunit SecA
VLPVNALRAGSAPSARTPAPARAQRASRKALRTQAFFGVFKSDPSENTRKKYQDRVDQINKLEAGIQALSDDQLRAKTQEFKKRVQGGESLDAVLPEAFAVGDPLGPRAGGGQ